jgi:hypothetical protein
MAAPIRPWTGKTPQWQHAEKSLQTSTPATLVNGTTIFRVIGGPIIIQQLTSYCITVCDSTASTLLWSADGDVGAATPFTAACASLASFAAGGAIICSFATISTAPALATAGVGLSGTTANGINVPAGIITTTIGSGPTTGTFLHFMRFMPLSPAAYVILA